MTDGVKHFLQRLGLGAYFDMFVAKGFSLEDDIPHIDEGDLNSMYIFDESHRNQLLQAAPLFKPSREFELYEWLRSKGLDHYYIGFVQSELTDLMEISRVNLPDEELYDELEITLPGHKRRLERAVQQLKKKHKLLLPPETVKTHTVSCDSLTSQSCVPPTDIPVTYGRWGKPLCLMDAKYDFLLMDATLVSTTDPRDRVHIEFMVDSGSDVVTIRQEVLDTMDLELIGPIRSKGVHAARTKNLYRANLMIGSEVLEVEVMGESYASIGSRVIRHFRHYISGNRHIWLKGDYVHPSMVVGANKKHAEELDMPKIAQSGQGQVESRVENVVSECVNAEHVRELEQKHDTSCPEESVETMLDVKHISADALKREESNLQTDFVKVKTNQTYMEMNSGVVTCDKIEFQFSTRNTPSENEENETPAEAETAADETDKVQCTVGEVIDVRPIIAANRKRRVNDTSGFDPAAGLQKVRKEDKQQLLFGGNTLRALGCYSNGVSEEDEEVQTVVKQRSIYYRSEVRRKT